MAPKRTIRRRINSNSNQFARRTSETKPIFMKTSNSKLAAAPENPVFPMTIRKRIAKSELPIPGSKAEKRDNIVSKSRDMREDRSTREMKTSQNARSFPHVR